MKSFLRYLQALDSKASSAINTQSRINPFNRHILPNIYKNLGLSSRSQRDGNRRTQVTAKCLASFWLWGNAIAVGSFFVATPAAQALPKRKDWCGVIWSVENTSTLAWMNPNLGAATTTTTSPGPTSEITMPTGSMGTSVAAIGIHTGSGTMFAFDRTGTTGTLYKYKFGVDTAWTPVSVTGLVGLSGTSPVPGAINNLNKMTVDGNDLYIADSTALALYTIKLDNAGNVISNATSQAYTFVGDPTGTPPHNNTSNPNMNGGDITTDEYGDTYNITYNNIGNPAVTTKAYFYKQDPVGKRWIYQGETSATASFAGAAFYKGDLYVKAGTQLQTIDLTYTGGGYTGWGNPVKNVGSPSSTASADLTSCGTPNVIINKTQKIYTNAAATSLSPNQGSVKTGQYIKYTITVRNIGDSWARASNIADTLPAGSAYVPNSATLNGANLNLATYPTTGFVVNTPGAATGIIDFSAPPSIATLTFVVQVTATTGSVQNRATITYIDNTGLGSEPADCTAVPTPLNCGSTPVTPTGEQFLLVKRITAINGQTTNPNDGTSLTGFVDDGVADNADNNYQWPSGYLVGATENVKIKSGDEVEYTIYYLNNGYSKLKTARICDRLDANLNYVNNFNASNSGKGISFTNPSGTTTYLTNTNADSDRGEFVASGGAIPSNCNLTGSANPSGVVIVDAADAANLMNPAGYGQVKFKTTVK